MSQIATHRPLGIRHSLAEGMHLRSRESDEARGTILWIHGLGESAFCFEGSILAPELSGWNHLAPDLPGYGKSPWLEEPATLPDFAVRLADLLEALEKDGRAIEGPLILAGHSMGGVIGTMLCEEFARRDRAVSGFLNLEGNISIGDCGFSSRVFEATPGDGTFEALIETLFREAAEDAPPEESDACALRVYYPSLRLCDERAYVLNGRELVELSRAEGLAPRLQALGVPTLYIYGAPRGTGERSRELLAASEIAIAEIRGAGHWPFLDQPEAFRRAAADFLSRF